LPTTRNISQEAASRLGTHWVTYAGLCGTRESYLTLLDYILDNERDGLHKLMFQAAAGASNFTSIPFIDDDELKLYGG